VDFQALLIKTVVGIHKAGFRASGGRLFNRGSGMPVLMLTTTGRKSGQPRTTMLTTPLQDGGRIMLVPSNGGNDRHPDWLLNLRADPHVEVTMNGTARPMTARIADPAEKAQLWSRIVDGHAHYGRYQTKTDRDIPVVVLEP
jgi:deazaflavin-dependent oxidoreductase (nitroreductase family)